MATEQQWKLWRKAMIAWVKELVEWQKENPGVDWQTGTADLGPGSNPPPPPPPPPPPNND